MQSAPSLLRQGAAGALALTLDAGAFCVLLPFGACVDALLGDGFIFYVVASQDSFAIHFISPRTWNRIGEAVFPVFRQHDLVTKMNTLLQPRLVRQHRLNQLTIEAKKGMVPCFVFLALLSQEPVVIFLNARDFQTLERGWRLPKDFLASDVTVAYRDDGTEILAFVGIIQSQYHNTPKAVVLFRTLDGKPLDDETEEDDEPVELPTKAVAEFSITFLRSRGALAVGDPEANTIHLVSVDWRQIVGTIPSLHSRANKIRCVSSCVESRHNKDPQSQKYEEMLACTSIQNATMNILDSMGHHRHSIPLGGDSASSVMQLNNGGFLCVVGSKTGPATLRVVAPDGSMERRLQSPDHFVSFGYIRQLPNVSLQSQPVRPPIAPLV